MKGFGDAVNGFFDFDVRLQELSEAGDPLVMLSKLVDWERFRPTLEVIRSKTSRSKGGRKPFDAVMMFKILILQSLYGLSDAQMTKKNNRSYFGYKNHIGVDVKHKFIRTFSVTDALVHDSRVFDELLDGRNTSCDVWADAAYRSPDIIALAQ